MFEIKCKSWNEFKAHFMNELSINSLPFERENFLFRGQTNPDWTISSSFDRLESDKSKHDLLISNFKKLCLKHEIIPDTTDLSDEVIAAFGRHNGLPTRLLDWSESPYTSAFFAFTGIKQYKFKGKNVCIWAINKKSNLFKREMGLKFVSIPAKKYNRRMQNQFGQFTLSMHTEDSIEEYINVIEKKYNIDDALWKFLIPSKDVDIVLEDLELMGINHTTIYPDVQGCVEKAIFEVL